VSDVPPQCSPIAVQGVPATVADQEAPLAEPASARQVTTGEPVNPALQLAVHVWPMAVPEHADGKAPFGGFAGRVVQTEPAVKTSVDRHSTQHTAHSTQAAGFLR
jgi:hypothetical protein